MLDILEVPEVRRHVLPIDVEAYHRMGEAGLLDQRAELLRGVIFEKVSKSPLHEYVATQLMAQLSRCLPDGFLVRKEGPLTLLDSEPEPDLAVVMGSPADYRNGHPTTARLVVEIAISSEQVDREKSAIYAEADVPEFWLVLPERRKVELHTQPLKGKYTLVQVFSDPASVSSKEFPAFSVSLPGLFA